MTIGGFVNMFLLKPHKNLEKKNAMIWDIIITCKLISMAFFCDFILQKLFPGSNEKKKLAIKFHVAAFWVVLSPLIRFFREFYAE
jgi:hypothetical protein